MELLTPNKLLPKQLNEVSILFSNDQEVRQLNKTYRKLDKTTDVLSFSMLEGDNGKLNPSELGDIVISMDMAVKQAKRFRTNLDQELLRLIIHACLHLFGYDHVKVALRDVKLMKRLEQSLLDKYRKALA